MISQYPLQFSFEQQVLQHPHKTAVIVGDTSISYKELHDKSEQLAQNLISCYGIQPHERITLHVPNSIYQIIAILGVLKAGATYIPLDCSYPTKRKHYMVQNATSKLIIHTHNTPLSISGIPTLDIIAELQTPSRGSTLQKQFDLQDPLYVLYTSGSTGNPKGVLLRQRGILNMLDHYCTHFAMSSNDINFVFSSFAYDLTQKNILSALITGATLVLFDEPIYQPKHLIDSINKHQVTIINATPSAFYPLVDFAQPITQLKSLKWIFLGGEKINSQRITALSQLYPNTKVVNTYGPTECSDLACTYILTKQDLQTNHDIPLGPPIPNVNVFVLDEQLNEIKDMQPGEVYLGGVCLGDGYINQPELTSERFLTKIPTYFKQRHINCLYRVGDLGHWDEKGRLHYLGRIDDQVKLRGNRVELSEIDQTLERHPNIKQSVTVMLETKNQQILISFYLSNKELKNKEIKLLIGQFLPNHMIPNRCIHIDRFPLTPNAKVDRQALLGKAQNMFMNQSPQ